MDISVLFDRLITTMGNLTDPNTVVEEPGTQQIQDVVKSVSEKV